MGYLWDDATWPDWVQKAKTEVSWMILACGTCTHWIVWTAFPVATPWAVTFMVWFLALSLVGTVSRAKLMAVPRLPAAVALVLGSLVLAAVIAGPLAGLWFAPSCLLGSASAVRLSPQHHRARRIVLSAFVVAIAVLGALWARSNAAYSSLGTVERILLVERTPAWAIELRRVGRGDCATLKLVTEGASAAPLIAAAEKRVAAECAAR
jgi:hypothetical protein